MAEDDPGERPSGQEREPPRERVNGSQHSHTNGYGERGERGSPCPSDNTGASYPPLVRENGVNGTGSVSEDSMDSYQDGPLDFSINKRAVHELQRGREQQADYSDEEREAVRRPHPVSHLPGPRHDTPGHNGLTHRPDNGLALAALSGLVTSMAPDMKPEDRRVGEPQVALPGKPPALPLGLPPAAFLPGLAGLNPNMFAGMAGAFSQLDDQHRKLLAETELKQEPVSPRIPKEGSNGSNGGTVGMRPFKSYPKENLPAIPASLDQMPPGFPVSGVDLAAAQAMAANSEELFAQYRDYMLKHNDHSRSSRTGRKMSVPMRLEVSSTSPDDFKMDTTSPMTHSARSDTPTSSASLSPSMDMSPTPSSPTSGGDRPSNSRKRGKTCPDENKDEQYWERRRKNNEAAKRSRDARRAKEDEIAIRAAFLEQENLKLRVEVTALKNETAKLRCMLYNS